MLTKMIRRKILEIVSSSDFIETFIGNLCASQDFRESVLKIKEPIVVSVGDGDIVIVPSSGISDFDFDLLTRLVPRDRRIGVVAADDVKILRLT